MAEEPLPQAPAEATEAQLRDARALALAYRLSDTSDVEYIPRGFEHLMLDYHEYSRYHGSKGPPRALLQTINSFEFEKLRLKRISTAAMVDTIQPGDVVSNIPLTNVYGLCGGAAALKVLKCWTEHYHVRPDDPGRSGIDSPCLFDQVCYIGRMPAHEKLRLILLTAKHKWLRMCCTTAMGKIIADIDVPCKSVVSLRMSLVRERLTATNARTLGIDDWSRANRDRYSIPVCNPAVPISDIRNEGNKICHSAEELNFAAHKEMAALYYDIFRENDAGLAASATATTRTIHVPKHWWKLCRSTMFSHSLGFCMGYYTMISSNNSRQNGWMLDMRRKALCVLTFLSKCLITDPEITENTYFALLPLDLRMGLLARFVTGLVFTVNPINMQHFRTMVLTRTERQLGSTTITRDRFDDTPLLDDAAVEALWRSVPDPICARFGDERFAADVPEVVLPSKWHCTATPSHCNPYTSHIRCKECGKHLAGLELTDDNCLVCPDCNSHHWSRVKCGNVGCTGVKPQNLDLPVEREPLPGDWHCACKWRHYALVEYCPKCFVRNPNADWHCAECNMLNFFMRDDCIGCDRPRPNISAPLPAPAPDPADAEMADEQVLMGNRDTHRDNGCTLVGNIKELVGSRNTVTGNVNVLRGDDNTVHGDVGAITGRRNRVYGTVGTAAGSDNRVYGSCGLCMPSNRVISASPAPGDSSRSRPATGVSMTSVDADGRTVTRVVIGSQVGTVRNVLVQPAAGGAAVAAEQGGSAGGAAVAAAATPTPKLPAKRRAPASTAKDAADGPGQCKRGAAAAAKPGERRKAHTAKRSVYKTMSAEGTKLSLVAEDGSVETYDTAAAPVRTSFGTVKAGPGGSVAIKWD
jgi:hypothetical protein